MMNKFEVKNMDLYYGSFHALKNINIAIPEKEITAFIGPSGCGKSTFLKSLNRMNDLVEGCRISGDILLDGVDIYKDKIDVNVLRKRVGMVFQKPNPFPMSIYDNIAYGPRTHGVRSKAQLDEIVEKSLRGAAIWDEVKDRLNKSALGMSGGQQQRLCIARALAVEPEVLLMDEPTSALDPISTSKVEELALELKDRYTIVIVTHNMQQAARISDKTAFFLLGELVEMGDTERLFSTPVDKRTEDYISGRLVDRRSNTMPSVRKSYDEELLQLDTLLARMGHEAGAAIESALTALRNDDIELARSVVARDSQIDAGEHEIEHRCLQLLLRQQPVASDLRKVSTALKMVTDVERIGDQASDIAELVLHLHAKSTDAVGVLEDILKMGDDVLKMVKRSIAAYVQVDLAAAAEVIAHDDVIDAAFRRISSEIAQYIAAHPTEAETALDLFMVTKYLERLGDHAVNVAEWVEFLKTGVHKSRKIV